MTKYQEKKQPNFNAEIGTLFSVFEKMKENGLQEKSQTNIDFNFTSDKAENLQVLLVRLQKEFELTVYYCKKLNFLGTEHELSVELKDIIMDTDLLTYLFAYLFEMAIDTGCIFGDWGASIENKLFDFESLNTKDYIEKAYDYYEKGFRFKAYNSFYIVAQVESNSEAYYSLANLKYEIGIVKSAITFFGKAIDLCPNNPLPYLNRGVAFYDITEYEKAIIDYEKVVELTPDNPDAYINLANAYIQLRDKDQAVSYYDKAIALGAENAVEARLRGIALLEQKA